MTAMQPSSATAPRLRVLLFSSTGRASTAFTAWLLEQQNLVLATHPGGDSTAFDLAMQFRPHAVLVDLHELPVSPVGLVARVKTLHPMPRVLVLTHEPSATLRRRCREAGADGVFDKTAELAALRAALAALLPPPTPPRAT
jgi:DNA-binding response OmpR family regulator